MTETTTCIDDARGYPQGELFLIKREPGKLTGLGGAVETHPVSDEAVEEAQTAAATDET